MALADCGSIIAFVLADIDHGRRNTDPFLLQRHDTGQPVHLGRVVQNKVLQGLQLRGNSRPGDLVRLQVLSIAGQQIATHSGFHVDRQARRLVGIVDHPVGMVYPAHHRDQVHQDGDENHHAEHAHGQRQGDVAYQHLAEALFVDR